MTRVLITVDTELSALLHQRGASARANFESSILGRTGKGDFGIIWQMTQLEKSGLTGIFFIDPIPALVHGEQVIADIVGLVRTRGHDVQLHAHTEWLEWAKDSPVEGRTGRNIKDFALSDQIALLGYGADVLTRAGAPRPIAFRAGNFGANDDTLKALAAIGLAWDSSVNAEYRTGECHVRVPAARNMPIAHCGVVELPVSGLMDRPGHFRPAQICAVSAAEMRAALDHAASGDDPVFTIVTHSFEMLSRDRARPNRTVMRRFKALARTIAGHPGLETAALGDLDPAAMLVTERPRCQSTSTRTLARIGAQAWATWAYERQLRPA